MAATSDLLVGRQSVWVGGKVEEEEFEVSRCDDRGFLYLSKNRWPERCLESFE